MTASCNCSSCNNPITPDDKFCNICGTKIPIQHYEQSDSVVNTAISANDMVECPFCAESIKKEAIKCKHCGSMLNQISNSQPHLEQHVSEDVTHSRNLENAVLTGNFIAAISALSTKDQAIYNAEVERRKKNTGIAYLFYFILHWCGAEKFYIGERGWGIAYLLTPLLFVVSLLIGLWLQAIAIGVIYLGALCFDLFCIPGQVHKANNRIRREILADLCEEGPTQRDGWLDAPQTWIMLGLAISVLTLSVAGFALLHKYQEISGSTSSGLAPATISEESNIQTPAIPIQDSQSSSLSEASPSPMPTPITRPMPMPSGGSQSLAIPSPSSQTENTRDSAASIVKLLQAESNGDDTAINEIIASLENTSKPMPGNSTEANRLNKVGLKYLKDKNYVGAVTFFDLASKADSSDAKYLSNLGFAEMNAGDLHSAKEHLYASIAMAPSRSVSWGDLGEVFAKKGEQDKAVACFLIGYKVSGGDTLGFLQSLKADDDPAIREAGDLALVKVASLAKPQTY